MKTLDEATRELGLVPAVEVRGVGEDELETAFEDMPDGFLVGRFWRTLIQRNA